MKALIQTGSSLSACGHAQAGGRVPVPLKSDFLSINYQGAAEGILTIAPEGEDPFVQWLQAQELDPQDSRYEESADADGDGMTTWQEYLADTDPASATSVLRLSGSFVAGPDHMVFTFPASTARYYQLEFTTNLLLPASTSNLGWGVPGQVFTNDSPGVWHGRIRSLLNEP